MGSIFGFQFVFFLMVERSTRELAANRSARTPDKSNRVNEPVMFNLMLTSFK